MDNVAKNMVIDDTEPALTGDSPIELADRINELQDVIDRLERKLIHPDRKYRDLDASR